MLSHPRSTFAAVLVAVSLLSATPAGAERREFSSTACRDAINFLWPAASRQWALTVSWRESNWNPYARNRSGASGCFQLMLPLHNRLFRSAGVDPAWWSHPLVNTWVAMHLYRSSGTSPWVLTSPT